MSRRGSVEISNPSIDLSIAPSIRPSGMVAFFIFAEIVPAMDDDRPDLHIGISSGDPTAFRSLITLYFPVLCAFAGKYLPDEALAKDIVQEVFIRLWSGGHTFSTMQGLKGYLFVSVRNGCLNLIRDRGRMEARHAKARDEQNDMDIIVESEYLALIYRAVVGLPKKMQEVFYLSYREGMSVKEIAHYLNMNPKAVKRQKYKALVSIRRRLNGNQGALLVALVLLKR